MSLTNSKEYVYMGLGHTLSLWWSTEQRVTYNLCLLKRIDWLSKTLRKNFVSLVRLRLPSACWEISWRYKSEKQSNARFFLKFYSKKKELPFLEKCHSDDKKILIILERQVTMLKWNLYLSQGQGVFGQSFGTNPNHSQTARENLNEGGVRYTGDRCQCQCAFRFGRYRTLLVKEPVGSFAVLENGESVGNHVLLDEEEDTEISTLASPVCERSNQPLVLLRSCVFETRFSIVGDYFYRNLFQ